MLGPFKEYYVPCVVASTADAPPGHCRLTYPNQTSDILPINVLSSSNFDEYADALERAQNEAVVSSSTELSRDSGGVDAAVGVITSADRQSVKFATTPKTVPGKTNILK